MRCLGKASGSRQQTSLNPCFITDLSTIFVSQTGCTSATVHMANSPFYLTQALDVISNNLCKQGFLLTLAYYAANGDAHSPLLANVMVTVYILPFFFLSYLTGVHTENRNKALCMQGVKLYDLVVIGGVVVSYLIAQIWLTLLMIFLLGCKTAMMTPLKYAYMAEKFEGHSLLRANNLIQSLSLGSILTAMVASGLLMQELDSPVIYSLVLLCLSATGLFTSLKISHASSKTATVSRASDLQKTGFASVFSSAGHLRLHLFAIAWFWFLSASYMTQLINYLKELIGGNPNAISMAFAVFICGMVLGAWIVEGSKKPAIVNAWRAGILLSILCVILGVIHPETLSQDDSLFALIYRAPLLCLLLFSTGICAVWFISPLYAELQSKSPKNLVTRIMGISGVLNAGLIVLSTLVAALTLGFFQTSLAMYFVILGLINLGAITALDQWNRRIDHGLAEC